jgi:protein CpxP
MTQTSTLAFSRRSLGLSLGRVAVAVSLAVAAVAVVQAQPAGPMGPGPGAHGDHGPGMGHGGMGMMMGGGRHIERMLDSIGASADQKAKIRDIFKAAHEDGAKLHQGQQALHQDLAKALLAPQIDAAGAEAVRQKLSAGHDAVSKRHLKAMLDAAAVLTPEQRQKLAERMKARHEMMERHHRERQAADGVK